MVLEAVLEHVAAIGAGGDQRVHAELVELMFFAAEHLEPQLVGALDAAHAAAPAAAPVERARVFHFDEVGRDHLQQVARRLDHATAAHQLAGIVEREFLLVHALGLQAPGDAQLVEQFNDVNDLEGIRPTDEVRTLPAQRGIGVAAFGADDVLHVEAFGGDDDAVHQLHGDVARTDLDAGVGALEGVRGERPGHAGGVEDARQRRDDLAELDDLGRRQHHQVIGAVHVERDFETGLLLGLGDLGLERRQLHAHGAADFHRANRRVPEPVGRDARRDHAFARAPHHVDDVVAHRAHE